jgi:uracil-DNA glycosylase family 4
MLLDPDCKLCGLSEGRKQVVSPSGDPRSPVLFVGEAPGQKEDESGVPFVGKAGKMLDRLLREEGLPRDSIMITNTVKCRPPRNRRPKEEEARACHPYLERELRDRQLVVALGKTASESLLGTKLTLKDCANTTFSIMVDGQRTELIPTYHPSACLFNLVAREGLRETIRIVKARFPDL